MLPRPGATSIPAGYRVLIIVLSANESRRGSICSAGLARGTPTKLHGVILDRFGQKGVGFLESRIGSHSHAGGRC